MGRLRNVILVFFFVWNRPLVGLFERILDHLSIVLRNECCSVKGLSPRMKTKTFDNFQIYC